MHVRLHSFSTNLDELTFRALASYCWMLALDSQKKNMALFASVVPYCQCNHTEHSACNRIWKCYSNGKHGFQTIAYFYSVWLTEHLTIWKITRILWWIWWKWIHSLQFDSMLSLEDISWALDIQIDKLPPFITNVLKLQFIKIFIID